MKITDHLFVVPNVVANLYIIEDADGVTLIDAGLPRSEKQVLAYLASIGKSARDIKRIILTHSDLDHVGSLAALQKASGARTYASAVEAKGIADGKSTRQIPPKGFIRRVLLPIVRPFYKAAPFQVDEIVTDGQVLPVLGGLQVVDTAGHTPGHISLFAPAVGILFCGDSMVSDGTSLQGSGAGLTADEAKARAAEKRQAQLGARIVCPGHGPAILDAAGKFPQ
jgi:glyoxylase-like metal-dependent hydrolase (beta-lactamase superfamily II)